LFSLLTTSRMLRCCFASNSGACATTASGRILHSRRTAPRQGARHVSFGSKGEILRLSIALPSYPGERTFGPCCHSALRRSGNCPCRRHASPAHGPCNPHKFRQPDNLSAMVGVIDSISSGTPLAENVGLCWPRWHLAIGSDRATATTVMHRNQTGASSYVRKL
jgi:hypothetical protein